MNVQVEDPLRIEIALLGSMLGETIREIAGEEAFHVVEDLRHLAWQRRSGGPSDDKRIADFIAALPDEQLRVVIRAFSIFLDLLNLTEDRQRVRVLRQRAREAYPQARSESIRQAILRLKESGKTTSEMQQLLDQLHIELVFTAHPTDAKRRSVRGKLRRLRGLLTQWDDQQLPSERERTQREIRGELDKLWQTDFIRPWRPSVMQEVGRGLSIKPVLWREVPKIMEELSQSVHSSFGEDVTLRQPCLTFGSWIGGDRDGHPGVTSDVTEQTFLWLRGAALEFHLAACNELYDSLSLSQRQMKFADSLSDAIAAACTRWPDPLNDKLAEISPGEICRRWLAVIRWRLQQSMCVTPQHDDVDGAYRQASELAADVSLLLDAVADSPGGTLIAEEIRTWFRRIQTFGFHLARLDVRQDARQYREVLNEVLQQAGVAPDPAALDESGRQQVLVDSLTQKIQIDSEQLSPMARDTLALFGLLHRVANAFGPEAIGGHVISMTGAPSDVLTVLWLWKQTQSLSEKGSDPLRRGPELNEIDSPPKGQTPFRIGSECDGESGRAVSAGFLPIIPLFETIEDLEHAPQILDGMLASPAYSEHLRRQGNRQTVMLGYSDSTKDGGYLSACWSLHEAQQQLVAIASQYGVELTFFHGRGGSLGRGGGPAARSILSLPAGTFRGSLRLTEQGEVLADRYDDAAIAHRHLEQMLWSSLLASGDPADADREPWCEIMRTLSDASFRAYRELVEQPEFVDFFRQATPVSDIEQLPIGSRPSRRRGGSSLSDLRAIPWVFSWTQCRCLIPAWYGLGSAIGKLLEEQESRTELESMYRDWQFFRATIDNAELALAKTDLKIAEQYASLVNHNDSLAKIASMISRECHRSRDAILALTGKQDLLDGTPWLKESIRVRNRYIDPLNLIQVELLRRARDNPMEGEEAEERRHLTRLTINGIAAGMRTSG